MTSIPRAACVAVAFCASLAAQSAVNPESLSAWPYYTEIHASTGLANFVLDAAILDKARTDQADLRLYDAAGKEIPYALRIRREVDTHSLFTSREFNRAVEGTTSLVACDLGAQLVEHNEVVLSTAGNNFRRLADVEGSADGVQWVTLASQAILFRFTAGGRTVEQESIAYPVSRYRYLRVRVRADPQVDHAAPEIASIGVLRAIHAKGETVPFPGTLEPREADPVQGRPASIWRIDLPGRVPLQSLEFEIADRTFSRPFQLEIVDDPAAPVMLASGDLTRAQDAVMAPVRIEFAEQFAQHLKLTITDDRNSPLALTGATALSAMRQVVFQSNGTVRLYYGNPKALAPHYDIASRIPTEATGAQATLGPQRDNPVYRPEPKPLSERSPWLVYLVLTGACATLAAILLNLAKASARQARSF